jgi:hypothetical protein
METCGMSAVSELILTYHRNVTHFLGAGFDDLNLAIN